VPLLVGEGVVFGVIGKIFLPVATWGGGGGGGGSKRNMADCNIILGYK